MRGETVMVIVSKLHLLGDAAGYCAYGKFVATLFRSVSEGGVGTCSSDAADQGEPEVRFGEVGIKR